MRSNILGRLLLLALISLNPGKSGSQHLTGIPTDGFLAAESMKCDGKTDDTPAFNALIAGAFSDSGPPQAPVELQTIQLPAGKCRFASAPNIIPAGIKIAGSNGNRNGTWLIADYNEANHQNGFLTWDGSFRAAGGGLGGGLEHVHISKGSAKTGGTAIRLIGVNDDHRAGFMMFNDLYINSVFGAPGYWHHHFVADGTCCTAQGSNGIRDIILSNFYFGQSKSPQDGESILILNAVHAYLTNGLVFASEHGGIRISGLDGTDNRMSHDVLITNVNILGSLYIGNTDGIVYSGWLAGKLTTTNPSRNCFISGVIEGSVSNAGRCGIITNDRISVAGPIGTTDDDSAGILTMQNGSATRYFSHKFQTPPVCTASDNQEAFPVRVMVFPDRLTVKGHGNHKISYICVARE